MLLVSITALNGSHCSPEGLSFSRLRELRAGSCCVLLSTLEEASREAFVSSQKGAGIQQSPTLRSIVWTQNNTEQQTEPLWFRLPLFVLSKNQVEWISSGFL